MGGESAQGLRLPARPSNPRHPALQARLHRLPRLSYPSASPPLLSSACTPSHPLSLTPASSPAAALLNPRLCLSPHLFRGSRRAPFGITGGHDPTSFQSVLQPHIHDHTRCTSFVNGYADFSWKPVVYLLTCCLQQHAKLLNLWMFGCKRECRSKNLPRPSPSA